MGTGSELHRGNSAERQNTAVWRNVLNDPSIRISIKDRDRESYQAHSLSGEGTPWRLGGGTCQLTVRVVCSDAGCHSHRSFRREFRVQLTRLGENGKNGKFGKIGKNSSNSAHPMSAPSGQRVVTDYAWWRTTPHITRRSPPEIQSHEALQFSL